MSEDKILAEVGSRKITEGDVRRLRILLGEGEKHFSGPEGDRRLLDELINQELLYLDAIDKALDEEDSFIEEYESAKKQMLQQYALRRLLGQVQVSLEETEAYYEAHKDKYTDKQKRDMDELKKQIYMQLLLLKQQAEYVNYTKALSEKYGVTRK